MFVTASNGPEILILDATTGSQVTIFSGHSEYVTCLAFSTEGALLVSGSNDCTVKIWDVQTVGSSNHLTVPVVWLPFLSQQTIP